eukprot:COSAG06_NODE_5412_length_3499_cov_34.315294_1_plen_157_part_10
MMISAVVFPPLLKTHPFFECFPYVWQNDGIFSTKWIQKAFFAPVEDAVLVHRPGACVQGAITILFQFVSSLSWQMISFIIQIDLLQTPTCFHTIVMANMFESQQRLSKVFVSFLSVPGAVGNLPFSQAPPGGAESSPVDGALTSPRSLSSSSNSFFS